MKKVMCVFLLLIGVFGFFAVSSRGSINAFETIVYGGILCEDVNVDLSNIKIDVYVQEKKANVMDEFSFYQKQFLGRIETDEDGKFEMLKKSEFLSFEIDLNSLPDQYGVTKKIVYCKEEEKIFFEIYKVNDVSVSLVQEKIVVSFMSQDNQKLYVNYKQGLEYNVDLICQIAEIDFFDFDVVIEFGNRIVKRNVILDLNSMTLHRRLFLLKNLGLDTSNYDFKMNTSFEGISFWNLKDMTNFYEAIDITLSDYSFIQSSNFIIYYDINVEDPNNNVSIDNYVQCVLSVLEDCWAYYNNNGYINNELSNVIIKVEAKLSSGSSGGATYDTEYDTENRDIIITYNTNDDYSYRSVQTFNDMYTLYAICFHELFHFISFKNNIDKDNHWLLESTASFMTLYYMDEVRNVYCEFFSETLCDYIENVNVFLVGSKLYSDNSYEQEILGYSSMLLFAYIYEKYDDISIIRDILNKCREDGEENKISDHYTLVDFLLQEKYSCSINQIIGEYGSYNIFASDSFSNISSNYRKSTVGTWSDLYTHLINLGTNSQSSQNLNELEVHKYKIEYSQFLDTFCGDGSMLVNFDFLSEENLPEIYISLVNDGSFSSIKLDPSMTIECFPNGCNENAKFGIIIANSFSADEVVTYSIVTTEYHEEVEINLPLYEGETNIDLRTHFHNNQYYAKINSYCGGYYEFKVQITNPIGVELDYNNFEMRLYNRDKEIISKSEYSSSISENLSGSNNFIVYLNANFANSTYGEGTYYFELINKNPQASTIKNINLTIIHKEYNSPIFEKNYEERVFLKGDYMQCFNANIYTTYTVNVILEENDVSDGCVEIIIFSRDGFNQVLRQEKILDNYQNCINYSILLPPGSNLYICFYDQNESNYINITIEKSYESDFNIILDKNGVDDSLIGSEVTINGGERESSTISVGLTRCAFLDGNASTNSRVEYEWLSENEEIATVTDYGTIIGKKVGTAIIQAKLKNNNEYGYITVNIVNDSNENLCSLSLTTDLRTDGSVGTEVSIFGGNVGENTIHIGYTRLLSFQGLVPINKIQFYKWSSSDSTIATVSNYGTVKGLKSGVVIIYCEYKLNDRFIGQIELTII